jgi:hypothetical protein
MFPVRPLLITVTSSLFPRLAVSDAFCSCLLLCPSDRDVGVVRASTSVSLDTCLFTLVVSPFAITLHVV